MSKTRRERGVKDEASRTEKNCREERVKNKASKTRRERGVKGEPSRTGVENRKEL